MSTLESALRRAAAGFLLAAALWSASSSEGGDGPVLPPYDAKAPVASDPGVERRTLANGLELVVAHHPNPPGQVAVRVIVGAGSLSEGPDQIGSAYLAPRLLFARALETPAGQTLAQTPGAFDPPAGAASPVGNSTEHAWLALSAPAGNAADLASALRFVAEFLRAEELNGDAVARLRPQAQDDARRAETKADRLRRVVLPALNPDSLLGDRLAFPSIEDLCETDPDAVASFARARYAPMNTTVVVVGDTEPATIFALAQRELETLPAGAAEPTPRPSVQARPRRSVVVTTDPEATGLIAELIVTTPAPGPVRTQEDARSALAADLARTALERRLADSLDETDTPIKEVNAWAGSVPGPMFIGVATATGETARWRAVAALVVDAARALAQRGVSESELDGARRELLAALDDAARCAPQSSATERAGEIARAEASGSVVRSREQARDSALRLLPRITAEEVSRAAAERFDPSVGTLVLVFPPDFPAPSEGEARKAVGPAEVSGKPLGAQITPVRAEQVSQAPAFEPALPGGVAEVSVNPGAGVASAWLTNGLRVHYRETPGASNQISFAISLTGGRIQEDEATRGLTLSTQALWSSPATATISAAEMRERMAAIPLRLQYLIETDRVLLEFTVAGEHAKAALELIARLLEAPRVDPQALERWKWSEQRRLDLGSKSALGVLGAALERAVFPPNDPRIGSLSATELAAINSREAQGWAEHLCGGPIEVGIAGDLRASLVLESVAETLGRLTPRQRPTPAPQAPDAPRMLRPVGDTTAVIEYGNPNDPAGVLVSIAGADDRDTQAMAHMAIQSRILRGAITQRATVDRSLAQRIIVVHSPGSGLPGSGLLNVWGFTEPGLTDILITEIGTQLDRVGSDGITAAEFTEARAAALAEMDSALANPRFWAHELSDRTFRARGFDDPQKLRQAIEAATAPEVAATLARFEALGERVRLKAQPITTPR